MKFDGLIVQKKKKTKMFYGLDLLFIIIVIHFYCLLNEGVEFMC
jgi:hypothetical protein